MYGRAGGGGAKPVLLGLAAAKARAASGRDHVSELWRCDKRRLLGPGDALSRFDCPASTASCLKFKGLAAAAPAAGRAMAVVFVALRRH